MFGALELDADGHMSFDLYGTTYASIEMGDVFERPLENTFGGTLLDQSNGELKIMPTCPQDGDPFVFRYQVVDERLTIQFDFNVFVPGTVELVFERPDDRSSMR